MSNLVETKKLNTMLTPSSEEKGLHIFPGVRGKMKNQYTDADLEKDIRKYVETCFKDAYESEGRPYETSWSFEYLIVNHAGHDDWILISFIRCKYSRVKRKVEHRLSRNLEKNFGIHYGSTELIRFYVYESGTIDPNHTEFMFKYKGKLHSLSLFDVYYDDEPRGQVIRAGRYEKLILAHYNYTLEKFRQLYEENQDSELVRLPSIMLAGIGWPQFKKLYKETFGEELGSRFNLICSSGIERVD